MAEEEKGSKTTKINEGELSFGDLKFEEVLSDLLKIKPVENSDLKRAAPKQKKRKPTSKK